jgi:hypothetical protein
MNELDDDLRPEYDLKKLIPIPKEKVEQMAHRRRNSRKIVIKESKQKK